MTNAVRHLPVLALSAGLAAIAPAKAQTFSLLPNLFQEETQALSYAPEDEVIQEAAWGLYAQRTISAVDFCLRLVKCGLDYDVALDFCEVTEREYLMDAVLRY